MMGRDATNWISVEADISSSCESFFAPRTSSSKRQHMRRVAPATRNGIRIANDDSHTRRNTSFKWELEFFLLKKLLQLIWRVFEMIVLRCLTQYCGISGRLPGHSP